MATLQRKINFERFVAKRYLTAKRKQAVISLVTVISVLGVAAGVMALIIALAITNGFRNTLQRSLLGATAHVTILEKEPGQGLENYAAVTELAAKTAGVRAATPVLYGQVLFSGPMQGQGGVVKGMPKTATAEWEQLRPFVKQGKLERVHEQGDYPPLLLGAKLAQRTGMLLDSIVTVICPTGELTPMGPRPSYTKYRVVGIFETGFFDLDNGWAFSSLAETQRLTGVGDIVNAIELKVQDVQAAAAIAKTLEAGLNKQLVATPWQEQNKQILNALQMDRVVTVITISLIQLVAALNILITLTMMVMEKNRDIAILVSMGARTTQIRRIFIYQGLLIGGAGCALGLVAGYGLSYLADTYRWFQLDSEIYALSFVPFEPRWLDGVWVTLAALAVSYLATLLPARQAAKVLPAEALRYE